MRTDTPKTIYLKNYEPPAYQVDHIELTFQIFEGRTVVHNQMRLRTEQGGEDVKLDGENLELKKVALDGKVLSESEYTLTEHSLTIPCPGKPEFTIDIETEIVPEKNTALEGLYMSGGNYCTQCEPHGFRRITYYLDRPDVLGVFTTRIEADREKCPVLLSNGNKIAEGQLDDGRHYATWEDPFPKPCYLFALVAGDLVHIHDTFTTMSGKDVDLYIYVRGGDEDQCWHAMESLKKSMKWDEEVYGREYDLNLYNIVAVSDFNMGAMENKSLNIFNTALTLAHPETATDNDFLRVEGVIAHEYFHNWTGNRITCRDWFQLSLKEGLTVFRDQEFSADMNSRAVQRIDDVTLLRRMQFAEDEGPLAHPVRPDNYIEINNFYTVTVYDKGAEVIRMMHTLMGPETYRKATDLYFNRHDGQAVTCEDFAQCMQDASGIDLTQFRLWYEQAGTPEVEAEGAYDEETKTYTLNLKQTVPATAGQPKKKPMHIPVAVGLIGPNGEDIIGTEVLSLTQEEQIFTFEGVALKPIPSILRNFSAPVKLKTNQSDDDLRFLMVHDSDGFNRWEAGQTLALRMFGTMLDVLEQGGKPLTDPAFIDSFSNLLDQVTGDTDKYLLARSLGLPGVQIIGQQRRHIDPTAIYDVRMQVINDLAHACGEKMLAAYEEFHSSATFSVEPEAIAWRCLKNTMLSYLAFHPENPFYNLMKAQYDGATNMTDRVAALALMLETDSPGWQEALADYYERFKEHQLVVDKWFSLQAMTTRPDAIMRVRELRDHPEFNIRNPNRVRSLYAAFAMNNPVCFHDPNGTGYDFLCEAVMELNDINPQIAARMLTPMREWRRYTPDRQEKMKAALQKIVALENLSPDVYEVVSKSLA